MSGGVYDPAGLDIATMSAYAQEHGSLEGWATGVRISNEELLELECDILVLAARENQVTLDERGAACSASSSPRAPTARSRSRPTRS